jgi:hypothetical protein
VDVRRAPRIVAREDGVELHNAVGVRHLDAAAVSRLQTSLAAGGDARVDAGRVASPLQQVVLVCDDYYKVVSGIDVCGVFRDWLKPLIL